MGSPRTMASSRPLIICSLEGAGVSRGRSGMAGNILASVVGKVVMKGLRLKLAGHEALAQPCPQPHGRQIQKRNQKNQNQRRREHHGFGRFAVLALKTDVINVKAKMHEAAL